jgi:hypothetical protein
MFKLLFERNVYRVANNEERLLYPPVAVLIARKSAGFQNGDLLQTCEALSYFVVLSSTRRQLTH